MTEAVTTELARLGTVSVASHTSAMQFAGQRRPMREIAAALKSDLHRRGVGRRRSRARSWWSRESSTRETDRKIWVADYRGARDDVRGIAQRIAFDVSAEILKRERTGTA